MNLNEIDKLPDNFKVYLYQMPYSDIPELVTFTTNVDGTPITIKLNDPADYDTSTILNWTKINENFNSLNSQSLWNKRMSAVLKDYKIAWSNQFRAWETSAVGKADYYPLRRFDVSDNVLAIKGWSNESKSFTHDISIDITLDNKLNPTENIIDDMKEPIKEINENDIFEIQFVQDGNSIRMFLGFVSSVSQSESYGKIPTYGLTVTGIYKLLALNKIVKDNSLTSNLENGIQLAYSNVSVFADTWNDKSSRDLFEGILRVSLGLEPHSYFFKKKNGDSTVFDYLRQSIVSSATFDKLNNIKNKYGLYGVVPTPEKPYESQSVTAIKNQSEERIFFYFFDPNRFLNLENFSINFLVLYPYYVLNRTNPIAFYEYGDVTVFNAMLKKSFEYFYPSYTDSLAMLDNLRSKDFYDVFQASDGHIICRSPVYNTLIADERFIIREDEMMEDSYNKQDYDIRSLSLTKMQKALIGQLNFLGGSYTDISAQIKYGFRPMETVTNPNAIDPRTANLFSALSLIRNNALTRQINMSVKLVKPYEVGFLYYIEKMKKVGYLVSKNISMDYGSVPTASLVFEFVRNVDYSRIPKPVDEIAPIDPEWISFLQFKQLPILSDLIDIVRKDPSLTKGSNVEDSSKEVDELAKDYPLCPGDGNNFYIDFNYGSDWSTKYFKYVPVISPAGTTITSQELQNIVLQTETEKLYSVLPIKTSNGTPSDFKQIVTVDEAATITPYSNNKDTAVKYIADNKFNNKIYKTPFVASALYPEYTSGFLDVGFVGYLYCLDAVFRTTMTWDFYDKDMVFDETYFNDFLANAGFNNESAATIKNNLPYSLVACDVSGTISPYNIVVNDTSVLPYYDIVGRPNGNLIYMVKSIGSWIAETNVLLSSDVPKVETVGGTNFVRIYDTDGVTLKKEFGIPYINGLPVVILFTSPHLAMSPAKVFLSSIISGWRPQNDEIRALENKDKDKSQSVFAVHRLGQALDMSFTQLEEQFDGLVKFTNRSEKDMLHYFLSADTSHSDLLKLDYKCGFVNVPTISKLKSIYNSRLALFTKNFKLIKDMYSSNTIKITPRPPMKPINFVPSPYVRHYQIPTNGVLVDHTDSVATFNVYHLEVTANDKLATQ